MECKRGMIFTLDLGVENKIGSEQKGMKLGIVVSNDIGNLHAPVVTISIITSSLTKAKLPTHVEIPASVGMRKKSFVLTEQTFVVSKERLIHNFAKLEDLSEIDIALKISLGIK